MTADPIRDYLDSRQKVQNARERAERLVATVAAGAAILRDWRSAMVSNVQGGFPPKIALSAAKALDGSDWPSGQQIADALIAYHDARHNQRNAFALIPDADQPNLQPPE